MISPSSTHRNDINFSLATGICFSYTKKIMKIKGVISDMDGVIYRGNKLIPEAKNFIESLHKNQLPFFFLTNNSELTALDLKLKMQALGIEGITENNFITSAMATAIFLKNQKPGSKIFVIGKGGLINELYNAGFSLTEHNPDYVVVGKTNDFNFTMLKKAVNLINQGAKFIGTNPDVIDPIENGIEPACGSILAAIEKAANKAPYIIGKPNALIMTIATQKLNLRSEEILMVGDRMDTDIVAGLEAGMKTCLVLTGVSQRETVNEFPFQPNFVLNNVGEIQTIFDF